MSWGMWVAAMALYVWLRVTGHGAVLCPWSYRLRPLTGWPILNGETEDSRKASIHGMDFRFGMKVEVARW